MSDWVDDAKPTAGNPSKPPDDPVGAPTPYIERKIDVTFTRGTGEFGEKGSITTTLSGNRVSATVTKGAVDAQTMLNLRIFGMPFKQMQNLSTYGTHYGANLKYGIRVDAGDTEAGMTRVFFGQIINAYFDGSSQPNVGFQVTAGEGVFEALKPVLPISIAGAVDVAQVMEGLAKKMDATFENHGVTAKLRDVYYPGTAYHQMRRIADHAGINATLENGVLAIWPRESKGRDRGAIPLISKLSGLKDYPLFDSMGIIATFLFRKIVIHQPLMFQSSLWDNEKRRYFPYAYTYTLESETAGGPWFTTVKAATQAIT